MNQSRVVVGFPIDSLPEYFGSPVCSLHYGFLYTPAFEINTSVLSDYHGVEVVVVNDTVTAISIYKP